MTRTALPYAEYYKDEPGAIVYLSADAEVGLCGGGGGELAQHSVCNAGCSWRACCMLHSVPYTVPYHVASWRAHLPPSPGGHTAVM